MPDKENKFGCTTSFETTTGTGVVVDVSCCFSSREAVKSALDDISELKVYGYNKEIVGEKLFGCYNELTRYDIKRCQGVSGGYECFGWWKESLEIKSPEGKCGCVISTWATGEGYTFFEFESPELAAAAWEKHFWEIGSANGCVRTVRCNHLKPWFYARAGEATEGDFVVSPWIKDDPVYRVGQKFAVTDRDSGIREVKTCLGVKRGRTEYHAYITVYWDDGTISSIVDDDKLKGVAPLKKQKLWQYEAGEVFKKLLAGEIDAMRIRTPDGKVITVSAGEAALNRCLDLESVQQTLWGETRPEALIKAKGKRKVRRWRGKGVWPVVAVETTVLCGRDMSQFDEEEEWSDKLKMKEYSRK